MQKIEIDGVGVVEVDPQFFNSPPEVQQATVEEIAASMRPKGPDVRRIKENAPKMASMSAPEEDRANETPPVAPQANQSDPPSNAVESAQTIQAMFDRGDSRDNIETLAKAMSLSLDPTELDAAFAYRAKHGKGARFVAEAADPAPLDFAAEEAAYQASLAGPQAVAPKVLPSRDQDGDSWRLPTVFANAANKGVAGVIGLPVDLATAGINTLTPEWMGDIDPSKTVGGSASIRHLMDLPAKALGYNPGDFQPKDTAERYVAAAGEGVGGALLPAGGLIAAGGRVLRGGAAKQALQKLSNLAAAAPGRTLAVEASGGVGAGLGAEAARDAFPDNPLAPAIGSIVGGSLGGAAVAGKPLATAMGDARFAKAQEGNPYAAFDAEVAADASRIVSSVADRVATGGKLPKGQREATIIRRMDELERSYLPFQEVRALDLPPSRKAQLRQAMEQRHTLSPDDIEALRGSPEGDAVADAITKARRLRHYVPEGSADVEERGLLGFGFDTAGAALGAAVAGPKGAVASRLVGRALASPSGGNRIPSAKAAQALAKLEPRFAKLRQTVGGSGANASAAALKRSADSARDVSFAAEQANRASRAKDAAERVRLETEGRKLASRNALDNVKPNGGFRGFLYERTGLLPQEQDVGALRLVAEGKISREQLDLFLSSPDKLQVGNAGNAIMDRLAAMAEEGTLTRDPTWTPVAQETAPVIRNPLAYQAAAKGNQDRVTQALANVQGRADLSADTKDSIGSVIARLGSTSDKTLAEFIVRESVRKLPKADRPFARSILNPLAAQIK